MSPIQKNFRISRSILEPPKAIVPDSDGGGASGLPYYTRMQLGTELNAISCSAIVNNLWSGNETMYAHAYTAKKMASFEMGSSCSEL